MSTTPCNQQAGTKIVRRVYLDAPDSTRARRASAGDVSQLVTIRSCAASEPGEIIQLRELKIHKLREQTIADSDDSSSQAGTHVKMLEQLTDKPLRCRLQGSLGNFDVTMDCPLAVVLTPPDSLRKDRPADRERAPAAHAAEPSHDRFSVPRCVGRAYLININVRVSC
jgi:hypothetical protein